jgi:hypothetical protein
VPFYQISIARPGAGKRPVTSYLTYFKSFLAAATAASAVMPNLA